MKTITVTDEQFEWLRESLAVMSAMYADTNRDDWWDADDIARTVAEFVGDCIEDEFADEVAHHPGRFVIS